MTRNWTFLSVLLGILIILSGYAYFNENRLSTEKVSMSDIDECEPVNILDIIYTPDFLGFNSSISRFGLSLIGISSNNSIPDILNKSFPIYSYYSVNLSENYTLELLNSTLPEINIKCMTITLQLKADTAPYLLVQDVNFSVEIFRHGGFIFKNSTRTINYLDVVGNNTNAIDMAMKYLSQHGGIPDDISDAVAHYGTLLDSKGKEYPAFYNVEITRKIDDYQIYPGKLRNRIFMKINCGDGGILVFEKHWPKLDTDSVLDKDDMPSIESILSFYGMNSSDPNRSKIMHYEIRYMVPYSIQLLGTDAWSDVYYVAPYLFIYCERLSNYVLGLAFPENITSR